LGNVDASGLTPLAAFCHGLPFDDATGGLAQHRLRARAIVRRYELEESCSHAGSDRALVRHLPRFQGVDQATTLLPCRRLDRFIPFQKTMRVRPAIRTE
jgi:hypothetical protein